VSTQRTEDIVLDAARDLVLAYGVRRTTLTDVARRADLSRMSIYRRWPDVRSLVADLMSRELHALVVTAASQVRRSRGLNREIGHLVATVKALREHPLLQRIRDVDPETLLPYLMDRRGSSQQEMLGILTDVIAAGQAAGVMRAGDVGVMARSVLLTLQAFVLSFPVGVDAQYSIDDLDSELEVLLRRYLAP
jgi:AcrR family transcriptional regulator